MISLSRISSIFLQNRFDKKAVDYVLGSSVSLPNMEALLNGVRNSKEMDSLQQAVYIPVKILYELRDVTNGKNAIMDDMRAINDSIKIENGSAHVMDVSQTVDKLFTKIATAGDAKVKKNLEKVAKDFSGGNLYTLKTTVTELFKTAKDQNAPNNDEHQVWQKKTVDTNSVFRKSQDLQIGRHFDATKVSFVDAYHSPKGGVKLEVICTFLIGLLNDLQHGSLYTTSAIFVKNRSPINCATGAATASPIAMYGI